MRQRLKWIGDEPLDYSDPEVVSKAREIRQRIRASGEVRQADLYWLYRWERRFLVQGDFSGWSKEWSQKRGRAMEETSAANWESGEKRRSAVERWRDEFKEWATRYAEELSGRVTESKKPLVSAWVMGIKHATTRGDIERCLRELGKLCGHYVETVNLNHSGSLSDPKAELEELVAKFRGVSSRMN